MSRPRITHVAIRVNDVIYALPAPNRHHHVIWWMVDDKGFETVHASGDNQGFVDAEGSYLTRQQALVAALANDQVKDSSQVRCNMLFSEDVW